MVNYMNKFYFALILISGFLSVNAATPIEQIHTAIYDSDFKLLKSFILKEEPLTPELKNNLLKVATEIKQLRLEKTKNFFKNGVDLFDFISGLITTGTGLGVTYGSLKTQPTRYFPLLLGLFFTYHGFSFMASGWDRTDALAKLKEANLIEDIIKNAKAK